MNRKLLVLPALPGVLAPATSGCGSAGGGGGGEPVVVGITGSIEPTKDDPAPLAPAPSYDSVSRNILHNTFQMPPAHPRGSTTPSPDAARECNCSDQSELTCRTDLRDQPAAGLPGPGQLHSAVLRQGRLPEPAVRQQADPGHDPAADAPPGAPQYHERGLPGRLADHRAQDVPGLPLWQGKQYIAARSDITGTEWALNSSTTTQFWELGRGAAG